jgi:hypothetical protein
MRRGIIVVAHRSTTTATTTTTISGIAVWVLVIVQGGVDVRRRCGLGCRLGDVPVEAAGTAASNTRRDEDKSEHECCDAYDACERRKSGEVSITDKGKGTCEKKRTY